MTKKVTAQELLLDAGELYGKLTLGKIKSFDGSNIIGACDALYQAALQKGVVYDYCYNKAEQALNMMLPQEEDDREAYCYWWGDPTLMETREFKKAKKARLVALAFAAEFAGRKNFQF